MNKNFDDIKSQFSSILQKLINDTLALSGGQPLIFADEQEYQNIFRTPFSSEWNASFWYDNKRFFIFLKQLNSITQEEESAIAHEMGHLWLMLEGSPQVKRTSDTDKQTAYDTFFGPLREFMEHAVFYPRLKKEYQIDLYKIGSKRLFDFIKEQLPNFKSKADNEKLLLLLNYIKYYVESDNNYWRKRLQNQYSKKHLMDIKEIAENVLHIILKLPDRPFEPEYFITKYYEILTFLETRFSVPRALWPQFIKN